MGYWQNGYYFMGDRIIPKEQELTDKEISLMLKKNLEKTYKEAQEEKKIEIEILGIDEFE
jgi:hypothetical protein